MTTATLADLLDTLGHHAGEHVSINHQGPDNVFRATVVPVDQAPIVAAGKAGDSDVWWGVNPVEPVAFGRGKREHVTRWAALYADLDVKDNGLPTLDVAQVVVDELSVMLGAKPVAVTYSGGGLQPYWAIDPDDGGADTTDPERRRTAQALMRRFGRLVAAVAERHGGFVDGVWDLSRVLRVPGTFNRKRIYDTPRLVTTSTGSSAPLSVDQVAEALDAYGIRELPEDREDVGAIVLAPEDWTPGEATCNYAATMIEGWAADAPDRKRHNWLVSQAVRLAAACRHGCITVADHRAAAERLRSRFMDLIAGDRDPTPGEVAGALSFGVARVSAMTDEQVAGELGDHTHLTVDELRPMTLVPTPPDGGTATPLVVLSSLTDIGNADLLVAAHAHRLRYVSDRGKWITWAGDRWIWQDDGSPAVMAARDVIETLEPADDAQRKHKQRSMSRSALDNAVSLARANPAMRLRLAQLDADPYALNTPAGVVDLRTGALRPGRPDDLHTRVTGVHYGIGEPTPRWLRFLDETFGSDAEMIGYVQRLLGYSSIGKVTHHILPFGTGSGGNGKSVLMETGLRALGTYATTAPADFLLAGGREDESAVARLAGQRLVVCSEVNQSARFNEQKVKLLTGGDTITARFLYQDHFTFTPTHHLWLMANHQPRVDAGGESFWRRLRLIDFPHTVPEERRIDDLSSLLVAEEGPGILAWIVEGARQVLATGLREPARVLEATRDYAVEEDALGRFVEERCRIGGGDQVRMDTKEMRSTYERWCFDEGEKPITSQMFGRELRSRFGIGTARSHGRRFYTNVTLMRPESDTGSVFERPEQLHWSDR